MKLLHGRPRLVPGSSAVAGSSRALGWLLACLVLSPALLCENARGQLANANQSVHYLLNANEAPGVIGGSQVARGVPGVGTFQAVALEGPKGLRIGLAQHGEFLEPIEAPVVTGMLVGATYRFRVTHIPFRPGVELYPTVEVIDRIFAPAGREHRFPIPVVLTADDLQLALSGALVTRVIYLEDAEIAEPIALSPGVQTVREVPASDNALRVADQLGRPVAILRIGSRVPSHMDDLRGFLYGSPPWVPLPPVPDREGLVASGMWPEGTAVEAAAEPFSESPNREDLRRTPAYPQQSVSPPE